MANLRLTLTLSKTTLVYFTGRTSTEVLFSCDNYPDMYQYVTKNISSLVKESTPTGETFYGIGKATNGQNNGGLKVQAFIAHYPFFME